jgi:hypothetical protein
MSGDHVKTALAQDPPIHQLSAERDIWVVNRVVLPEPVPAAMIKPGGDYLFVLH